MQPINYCVYQLEGGTGNRMEFSEVVKDLVRLDSIVCG